MDIDELYDEDEEETQETKYLLVSVEERGFAIPEENIIELIVKPDITMLPDAPDWNPGVITVREEIIPLVELRPKIGLRTQREESNELISILKRGEEDHRRWVDELMRCIKENSPFELAIDPHQCSFGKWYDSFDTENLQLKMLLRKFDRPHRAIHESAEKAIALEKEKGVEAAVAFIENRKNRELRTILEHFSTAYEVLGQRDREIAIILSLGRKAALSVDRVDNFASLDVESLVDGGASSLPLGRDPKSNAVYPVLTPAWIDNALEVEAPATTP